MLNHKMRPAVSVNWDAVLKPKLTVIKAGTGADKPPPPVDPVVVISRAAVYAGLAIFTACCWWGVVAMVQSL